MLSSHGADIFTRGSQGWTLLHVTSFYGGGSGISSLLTAGAGANARDNAGMDPVDHCSFSSHMSHGNHSEAMMILLQAGASFSSLKMDGCMPAQLAIITTIRIHSESDFFNILSLQADLISTKLPLLGRTALHFVSEAGCLLISDFL